MSALLLPAWVALAFILGAIPFGVVIAKLGKGIEPSGNILGVYLYPTFQTDGCPGVAENKDVHNESHHTAPLVQRTNAAG